MVLAFEAIREIPWQSQIDMFQDCRYGRSFSIWPMFFGKKARPPYMRNFPISCLSVSVSVESDSAARRALPAYCFGFIAEIDNLADVRFNIFCYRALFLRGTGNLLAHADDRVDT